MADLTGDGGVGGGDSGVLQSNWNDYGVGDLNRDGFVDAADRGLLNANWGPAEPSGAISTTDNIVGYAGYIFNAEVPGSDGRSGLYTVRHRHYSPDLGRWLSRDPLGYVDGMSLYEYVQGRPARFVDLLGLFSCTADRDGECECRVLDQAVLPHQFTPESRKKIDELIKSGKGLSSVHSLGRRLAYRSLTIGRGIQCEWDRFWEELVKQRIRGDAVSASGSFLSSPVDKLDLLIDAMIEAERHMVIWTKVERRCCECESKNKFKHTGKWKGVIPTFGFVTCEECEWNASDAEWVSCTRSSARSGFGSDSRLIDHVFHINDIGAGVLADCRAEALDGCEKNCP